MLDLSKYDGHTPGPWKLDGYTNEYIFGPNMEMVGETRGTGACLPQEINGLLMADSPLLLSECKRLQVLEKQFNDGCDGKCAPDECVCPQGGWEHKVDMLTIEIERLHEMVESLKCCANCDHSFVNVIDNMFCEHSSVNKARALRNKIPADHVCNNWSRE